MDATQTINHYEHSDVHVPSHPERRDEDALRTDAEAIDHVPARAILISVVIGAGLWALIIGAGWLIFR